MTDGERDQEENLAKKWAADHKYVYLDLRDATGLDTAIGLMSNSDVITYNVVPLGKNSGNINLGITPSTDIGRLQFIKIRFQDLNCHFFVISQPSFAEIAKQLDGALLKRVTSGSVDEVARSILSANGEDIFRLMAQHAHDMNASDIHIEPKLDDVLMRFRIDGALHPIMSIPFTQYKILLATLQTKAHMTWGSDRPQGGRVEEQLVDKDGKQFPLSIRLESIPTLHGEEIIARLLNMDIQFLDLDNISLSKQHRLTLDNVINHLHGMVLAVGPTSSGKTSLLYAIINKINIPEIKVVTMEDPIEYELASASQIPVNADDQELFAEKLRAVLRQDPNVIMLGEIRDIDTAKTALQAALTGHLVLSTFHANNSSAAVSRLMDMIGQNPLLPSALRLIIAKRLVRKVCDQCQERYTASQEEVKTIQAALQNVPETLYKASDTIELVRGKGCDACTGFGFHGRISILEMLEMTPDMEKLVTSGVNYATANAISEQAIKDGMITLLQDGILKVLDGQTTMEEVYRVIES